LIKLQEKIDRQSIRTVRWYQKGADSVEIPMPILGPDLIDPRRVDQIRRLAAEQPQTEAAASESSPEA